MDPRDKKQKEDDLKLVKDPKLWYNWPILPLKKLPGNGEIPEFGFLLAIGKPIVYLKNMYDLLDLRVTTIKQIMEKVEGKEYPSFENIIDDEWIVD